MKPCLYITDVGAPDKAVLQKLIPSSPKEVQAKISRAHTLIDKWRYFLSDLLTRDILAKELGISIDFIKIKYENFKKPTIFNKKRQFNISHSGNRIVLATDDEPVGIDIEYIQPFSDLEDLIMQFTQEEQQAYYMKPKEQRVDFFYELWTLKESYMKATGKGLSCSLQSFNIRIIGDEASLSRGIDLDTAWYFQRYTFDNQYKCAVCSRYKQFPEKALIIKAYDLLKR